MSDPILALEWLYDHLVLGADIDTARAHRETVLAALRTPDPDISTLRIMRDVYEDAVFDRSEPISGRMFATTLAAALTTAPPITDAMVERAARAMIAVYRVNSPNAMRDAPSPEDGEALRAALTAALTEGDQ